MKGGFLKVTDWERGGLQVGDLMVTKGKYTNPFFPVLPLKMDRSLPEQTV